MSVFINIRERDGAKRLTDALLSTEYAKHGDIIYSPVMSIVAFSVDIDWAQYNAVLLTSRHAVAALDNVHAGRVNVFCVGQATKDELVRQGYNNIIYTAKDAEELIRFLRSYEGAEQLRFCYLRAKDVSVDLAKTCDLSIDEYICYEAKAVDSLSDAARLLLSEKSDDVGDIYVPFYSRRSVDLFYKQLLAANIAGSANFITPLCISDSVLEYAQTIFRLKGKAAASPDMNGMLDICISVVTV